MRKEDPLFNLKSHPFYPEFEKQLLSHRPRIPEFSPGNDVDVWKYESGKQAGFDLVLSILKIEVPHE